jgi:uncharacterized OB-fold protein
MSKQVPIVDFLVLDNGSPHLVANACTNCGALFFGRHNACAKCGQRSFAEKALAQTGTLRSFTIVHRAAPGVPVPFVSSIVDLDEGGVVNANVINTPPDPDHVKLGMRVELTTFAVGSDSEGTEAIAFAFQPLQ